MELLERHLEEVRQLCERFEVRRLELFGSAARGEFDPTRSDLDFLVVFRAPGLVSPADRYFGLLIALEDLFARKVDLVDVTVARNPFFMAESLKHRKMLYAA